MNGVGLTAVGKLLGHRKRATTAIYAHLDDAALRDAAAQAATAIARAMEYTAPPPAAVRAELPRPDAQATLQDRRTPRRCGSGGEGSGEIPTNSDPGGRRRGYLI